MNIFQRFLQWDKAVKSYAYASKSWRNFACNRLWEGFSDMFYAFFSIILACVLICIMQKLGILNVE